MILLQVFFCFSGRINRADYWRLIILLAFAVLCAGLLAGLVLSAAGRVLGWQGNHTFALGFGSLSLDIPAIGELGTIAFKSGIAALLVCVPVSAKRLHDRGKSGWWLLVFFAAPAILSSTVAVAGEGLQPVLEAAGAALSVWAFAALACLRGTAGPNAYGDDPLAA